MEENQKKFQEFFGEILQFRGLNMDKLAESTGISKRYLTALYEGDFEKLPSLPHVRGYIIRIAEVVGMDGEQVWQTYKEEIVSQMKVNDRLPENRFAIKPKKIKKLAIGIVAVFAIIYLIWQIDNLLGIPQIDITNPVEDELIVQNMNIEFKGTLANYRDKLTINGEEIFISENGEFKKDYQLQAGMNTIELKAKRFLGKEVVKIKKVVFQPQ